MAASASVATATINEAWADSLFWHDCITKGKM